MALSDSVKPCCIGDLQSAYKPPDWDGRPGGMGRYLDRCDGVVRGIYRVDSPAIGCDHHTRAGTLPTGMSASGLLVETRIGVTEAELVFPT
jgi:hypothetical protein